ncbi:hypothetical protein [Wenjunlia tyrosinilytica]|uniref:Uncharacterized protein n=1 Tax=Wenjunlia tyrosinilytica TaxID=1544741 RepID=A0A917ZJF8_9ACTN|nr:hypothetical protein [Wenjunlia tyrosinilytica]GGO84177.1 hypothetical protein GCM10012280_15050 [Wenjunlia tyrosinilytica]
MGVFSKGDGHGDHGPTSESVIVRIGEGLRGERSHPITVTRLRPGREPEEYRSGRAFIPPDTPVPWHRAEGATVAEAAAYGDELFQRMAACGLPEWYVPSDAEGPLMVYLHLEARSLRGLAWEALRVPAVEPGQPPNELFRSPLYRAVRGRVPQRGFSGTRRLLTPHLPPRVLLLGVDARTRDDEYTDAAVHLALSKPCTGWEVEMHPDPGGFEALCKLVKSCKPTVLHLLNGAVRHLLDGGADRRLAVREFDSNGVELVVLGSSPASPHSEAHCRPQISADLADVVVGPGVPAVVTLCVYGGLAALADQSRQLYEGLSAGLAVDEAVRAINVSVADDADRGEPPADGEARGDTTGVVTGGAAPDGTRSERPWSWRSVTVAAEPIRFPISTPAPGENAAPAAVGRAPEQAAEEDGAGDSGEDGCGEAVEDRGLDGARRVSVDRVQQRRLIQDWFQASEGASGAYFLRGTGRPASRVRSGGLSAPAHQDGTTDLLLFALRSWEALGNTGLHVDFGNPPGPGFSARPFGVLEALRTLAHAPVRRPTAPSASGRPGGAVHLRAKFDQLLGSAESGELLGSTEARDGTSPERNSIVVGKATELCLDILLDHSQSSERLLLALDHSDKALKDGVMDDWLVRHVLQPLLDKTSSVAVVVAVGGASGDRNYGFTRIRDSVDVEPWPLDYAAPLLREVGARMGESFKSCPAWKQQVVQLVDDARLHPRVEDSTGLPAFGPSLLVDAQRLLEAQLGRSRNGGGSPWKQQV